MKRHATITLDLPSSELSEMVLKAIQPETRKPATSRARVHISKAHPRQLIMRIEAKDTSALRATLNSYLRWIALITDTYEAVASLQ